MRLAFPGLMAALAEGATIVTPTPALSSVAVEQFNRHNLALGNQSWQRPDIYSLDAWMTNCWQGGRFAIPNPPALLSLSQERELWRQIIEAERPDLFDLRAMASLSQRASRILAEYQIPTDGEAWIEHADAKEFLRWHQTFDRRLREENWITRAHLWRLLPPLINKRETVMFVALTALSPGLKRFAQQSVGITPSIQPSIASALASESIAHEMEQAARAVRYLLEEEHTGSIGILVADLPSHAQDLSRVLEEVLYPSGAEGNHIHIQSGRQISQPLVSNALLLLELAQPRIHHASAGSILRSSFIEGAAKERGARALAAAQLLRLRELDFTLADIEKVSSRCPILQKTLQRLRIAKSRMRPTMPLPNWSAIFSDILEAVKWPALVDVSQAEQRAVDQWKNALSEMASLGLVSSDVTYNQAVSHLQVILSRPSEIGDWSSPVQVLDAASSEAIEFHHSFFLNASEDAWPPPVYLSPLIPYKLQRLHQVPASDPESAAEERIRKTESLFRSSPHLQVSFSGNLAPVLKAHVRLTSEPVSIWPGLTANESFPPVELEFQEDGQAPPLALSDEVFPGGSYLIKAQSQCPFKAFAEYRLKARGDDEASFGFDALQRGTFIHSALENVWKNLKTQANLKSMSEAEIVNLVRDSVEIAVFDDGSGPIRTLTTEAERERVAVVVSHWLTIEKERPVPFSVDQIEQKIETTLSGLKLQLKVDRIDRLSNNSLVLIDYKTGAQTKTKLEHYRPDEPQLLVYTAAVGEPVEGLYFAELRNDGVRAVGHGIGKHFHKQQGIKDHKAAWDQFVEKSQETVERLASEFVQGKAEVDPLKGACQYCKVKPLCRVGAAALAEEDDE